RLPDASASAPRRSAPTRDRTAPAAEPRSFKGERKICERFKSTAKATRPIPRWCTPFPCGMMQPLENPALGRSTLGVSTLLAVCRRVIGRASVALVALGAAPCSAEIFTLIQPDGSLLITDQPPFPPATAALAVARPEHPIDAIARRHGVD